MKSVVYVYLCYFVGVAVTRSALYTLEAIQARADV